MTKQEKVLKILVDLSGKKEIKENDNLEGLGLDSLSMITMIIKIEDELEIELEEKDMNPYNFKTVNALLDTLEKY